MGKEEQANSDIRPTCYLPRRFNVVMLGFMAITLAYMMRSNLSIAILVMSQEFNWPLAHKGMFLSSFFWGYITTQLIGGIAARKFGPKVITTFVIVVPSILTMLVPFVAQRSEVMFVACRVLTGVAAGATFPTMYLMLSGWVPFPEKATSLAIVFSGVNIGTIVIDTVGPLIMSSLGWPFVFYFSGGVGFIWLFFWYLTVADTPAQMNNIHPYEQKYIVESQKNEHTPLLGKEHINAQNEEEIDEQDGADVRRIPPMVEEGKKSIHELYDNDKALSILIRCKSFWNIVWVGFCMNWGSYIFLAWLPTYVNSELGFSVQLSGIIAITPNISGAIVSFLSGKLCDYLLVGGYSKLKLRRTFFCLACIMWMITLVLLGLRENLGISPITAAIILAVGSGGNGFALPGYTANIYDIAPYHPSLVVGISNTAGTIPGIVGVYLTGVLLQAGFGWATIFYMTSTFYLLAMASFLIFGDVKRLV